MRSLTTMLLAVAMTVSAADLQAAGRGDCAAQLADIPITALTDAEDASLRHLRQEEKLARDVYLALAENHALPIFQNIAAAEQRHMDAVASLLQRHDLPDPVADDTPGVYADASFAELYRDLVATGEGSMKAALAVGAGIEDLDLKDLQDALAATESADITLVFENLARGSRNHMRAFAGRLEAQGESYAAQHLTDDELAMILAGDHERGGGFGRGRGHGNGIGNGKGMGRGHGQGRGCGGCGGQGHRHGCG